MRHGNPLTPYSQTGSLHYGPSLRQTRQGFEEVKQVPKNRHGFAEVRPMSHRKAQVGSGLLASCPPCLALQV